MPQENDVQIEKKYKLFSVCFCKIQDFAAVFCK